MSQNLVGLSNNIAANFSKIKVWARSFKKHCPTGNVTLLCANCTNEELKLCSELGINAIQVNLKDHNTVNHQRLIHVKEYLTRFSTYGSFIITDVFDVVFQGNPFDKYDTNAYKIYAGEEGVEVHQEPWNFGNISGLFPDDFQPCIKFPVVNSGVIGGEKEALIELYDRMYDMCENKATNAHNIKDQAAFIVMLAKNEVDKVKIFKLKDAWAVHCAVAGPTQFFESWGFKNKLIEAGNPIPYLEDGAVKINGEVVKIVHQFNRVPEWNNTLTEQYLY